MCRIDNHVMVYKINKILSSYRRGMRSFEETRKCILDMCWMNDCMPLACYHIRKYLLGEEV